MVMVNDPVGDLLTRIRNAQNARLAFVHCPASKLRRAVLDVLKREGYIHDFREVPTDNGHTNFQIEPRYVDGNGAIKKMSRVSKPGRRVYSQVTAIPRVFNGLGISILSTPRGVMSDREAREANVGGEVLCQVF